LLVKKNTKVNKVTNWQDNKYGIGIFMNIRSSNFMEITKVAENLNDQINIRKDVATGF